MKAVIFIITGLIAFAPISLVHAAEISFDQELEAFGTSQAYEIPVVISSPSERINAIEGEVVIEGNHLIEELIIGNSVISHWVVRPEIVNGKIRFSGIIPGGYQGDEVKLFSFILRTQDEGEFLMDFNNVYVFLHDGIPSEAQVDAFPSSFSVSRGISFAPGVPSSLNDATPPEIFYPEIVRDDNLYDGNQVLIFSAQDKGSGIDYYTVKEGSSEPVVAESPYLLENQLVLKRTEVTAYDLRGNQRTVVVHPKNPIGLEVQFLLILCFILLFSIIYIILKRLRSYEVTT